MADKKLLAVPSGSELKSKSKTGSQVSLKSRSRVARSQIASKSKLMSQSRLRQGSKVDFDDGEEWGELKDPVKPDDQLDLSAPELDKEFTRILRADNPHAPDNIVRFSFKEGEYRQLGTVEQCAIHFSLDGNMLHKESDEARRQLAKQQFNAPRAQATTSTSTGEGGTQTEDAGAGEDDGKADEGVGEDEGPAAPESKKVGGGDGDGGDAAGPKKALRNQFNFSERDSQTPAMSSKERGVQTDPPNRINLSRNACQWTIFDAYTADYQRQQALKEKKKVEVKVAPKKKTIAVPTGDENESPWAAAAKIVRKSVAKKIERMVNQNTFKDIAMDFKYWDDPSDEFKTTEGTFLPLWKFSFEVVKKMAITCVRWSPEYNDLVACGFGSFDFTEQKGGHICLFSLKSPSHPEYQFATPSGVMALDFCPHAPSLLAVGMYDGSVAVYDLSRKKGRKKPIYKCTAKTGKHTDPVWQVSWHADDVDGNKNFSSVSSDGRITNWTIVKSELAFTDLIRIQLGTKEANPDVPQAVFSLGSGTCFAFHPSQESVFLVGTEEGKIHKCSRAYSSKFLHSFDAHSMAVYAVSWNPFHPRIFASCSADWTVKIWDQSESEPVFTFDLGNSVGDIAWAPYSSTAFAAVTSDGKVVYYDLAENKYDPLCVQQVSKKYNITRIQFNKTHPIVVIGDDNGATSILKLSPNLRKPTKNKALKDAAAQVEMMDKLLDSVKEKK